MKTLTRYSPGAYGAMCEDPHGDYVRLSDVEGLLRWRDAITDMPTERGEYLVRFEYGNESWHEVIRWVPDFLSMGIHATHWRPIGPLPEGGE